MEYQELVEKVEERCVFHCILMSWIKLHRLWSITSYDQPLTSDGMDQYNCCKPVLAPEP